MARDLKVITDNAIKISNRLPLHIHTRLKNMSDHIIEIIISDYYKPMVKGFHINQARKRMGGYIDALTDVGLITLSESLDLVSYYETIRVQKRVEEAEHHD